MMHPVTEDTPDGATRSLSRAGYGLYEIEPHQDFKLQTVIARQAKQSREPGRPTTKAGLLRFARNDGRVGIELPGGIPFPDDPLGLARIPSLRVRGEGDALHRSDRPEPA